MLRRYASHMARITVVISDDLYALIQQERRRREVSVATVIRDALKAYLGGSDQPRDIPWAGVGRSGRSDIAARVEEILEQDWQRLRDR
jgi:hypothetical protein